jgi:hypothetical protein
MKIKINNKESGLIISNRIHMEIQNGFRFLDKKKEKMIILLKYSFRKNNSKLKKHDLLNSSLKKNKNFKNKI